MKKFSLIIGLASLVVIVSLSAASCRRAEPEPEPTPVVDEPDDTTGDGSGTGDTGDIGLPPTGDNPSGIGSNAPFAGLPDPAAAQLTMEKELTDATATILGLKDDLVLQLVSMKFVNSLSDQSGLATNYYIFSSPSDTRYYYLVNVPHNGERMKRFLMPREDLDLPFDLIQIQKQYWKLSYVDALRLVEAQGGDTFRSQHAKFEVSAILAKPAGQYTNWFVTYRATDGSGAILQASVDSTTGEVKIVK